MLLAPRGALLLLVPAALLAISLPQQASAGIDAPCSACQAVAAELQRRLEAEHDRRQLDMRHRLDASGQRYGRVLDWRLSELRAEELLDGLCAGLKDYSLVGGAWVRVKGERAAPVPPGARPGKQEEELRAAQLQGACALLLERHEDALLAALTGGQLEAAGAGALLCESLSAKCPPGGEQQAAPGGGPAARGDGEL